MPPKTSRKQSKKRPAPKKHVPREPRGEICGDCDAPKWPNSGGCWFCGLYKGKLPSKVCKLARTSGYFKPKYNKLREKQVVKMVRKYFLLRKTWLKKGSPKWDPTSPRAGPVRKASVRKGKAAVEDDDDEEQEEEEEEEDEDEDEDEEEEEEEDEEEEGDE